VTIFLGGPLWAIHVLEHDAEARQWAQEACPSLLAALRERVHIPADADPEYVAVRRWAADDDAGRVHVAARLASGRVAAAAVRPEAGLAELMLALGPAAQLAGGTPDPIVDVAFHPAALSRVGEEVEEVPALARACMAAVLPPDAVDGRDCRQSLETLPSLAERAAAVMRRADRQQKELDTFLASPGAADRPLRAAVFTDRLQRLGERRDELTAEATAWASRPRFVDVAPASAKRDSWSSSRSSASVWGWLSGNATSDDEGASAGGPLDDAARAALLARPRYVSALPAGTRLFVESPERRAARERLSKVAAVAAAQQLQETAIPEAERQLAQAEKARGPLPPPASAATSVDGAAAAGAEPAMPVREIAPADATLPAAGGSMSLSEGQSE
jgi:hypothetical protein